ncbi:MAG TPA: SLC13 family permease [Halobacteriales archaeon]|nr:SLC13 family permease [Halobacteriales archaeon]
MAPPLSVDAAVVFGIIAVAIVLFVTEALPADTTAVAVIVSLVVLEPWTGIVPSEALSGFANPATITVVAMYVLSGGIQSTGVVEHLGAYLSRYTGYDQDRLLLATVGLAGPLAGVVNNTPVVAVFIPMVTDLADRAHVSPSKVLIPLSYAAMLGGTLTLVGTATNLVASDLSAQLIDHPFGMFEFTPLGVLVLVVGIAYLLTVGQWLLPERIRPVDLTAKFAMGDYLSRVYVRRDSPIVGLSIEEAFSDRDVDVLQVIRGEQSWVAPGSDQTVGPGDVLTLRAQRESVRAIVDDLGLRLLPRAEVSEAELDRPDGPGALVEAVVPPGSAMIGSTLAEIRLRERYRATVLAIRRGGEVVHEELPRVELSEGDGLLLHATTEAVDHLEGRGDLLVTEVRADGPLRPMDAEDRAEAAIAVGIVLAVIAIAALGWLPIVIAALAGVVAMIATGVLRPTQAYDAVHWNVIFLLAGVLPLGLALQGTGGDVFLAGLLAAAAEPLPLIAILALFYLATGLLSNVITPVASVVLMLPIAVESASRLGADGFAFVLAVTFAASTAFMTPIGYQTNLMVYSPGGYRFTDYVRVGAPLQLILAVVTSVGIAAIWGVA